MTPEQKAELIDELICENAKFWNGVDGETYDCSEEQEGESYYREEMTRMLRVVESRYELCDRDERAALRQLVTDFDVYYRWAQVCDHEGCATPEGLLPLLSAAYETRERIAAELGIPLPDYPTYEEMTGVVR